MPPPIESAVEFSLWEKARRDHLPLLGMIELTRRCNLRCPYCYVGFARQTPPEEELSRKQVCSLIDQIADRGGLCLTFSGGEPFIRDDFRSIYQYAIKKGFLINVFTNGTLIDREIADFLDRYPPYQIDISLLGATEETYEKISGVPGSYRQFRQAIDLLAERDISFSFRSVINTVNRQEIRQMRKLAADYGKDFRFDALICAQLNGSRSGTGYRLSPQEVIELDYEDPDKWRAWLSFDCRKWGPVKSDRLYKCGGGLCSFHVSSSGQLGLCVLDTNFRYNLIRGSFREGWDQFIPRVRNEVTREPNRCNDCELRGICNVCPAWSTLENGTPEKPVEFLCQVTHLRAILLKETRRKDDEKEKALPKTRTQGR